MTMDDSVPLAGKSILAVLTWLKLNMYVPQLRRPGFRRRSTIQSAGCVMLNLLYLSHSRWDWFSGFTSYSAAECLWVRSFYVWQQFQWFLFCWQIPWSWSPWMKAGSGRPTDTWNVLQWSPCSVWFSLDSSTTLLIKRYSRSLSLRLSVIQPTTMRGREATLQMWPKAKKCPRKRGLSCQRSKLEEHHWAFSR